MTSNELAVERTELAIDRTLMGADRSLMAWIRTALSMISFGFTSYKVLQSLEQAGIELARHSIPRDAGLFPTGMDTIAMVMGTIEYWYRVSRFAAFTSTVSGSPRSSWPSRCPLPGC